MDLLADANIALFLYLALPNRLVRLIRCITFTPPSARAHIPWAAYHRSWTSNYFLPSLSALAPSMPW